MARNPVQLPQKGISLNAFLSLYGTEDQCFDALYQWRWPNGFLCPHCGHDRCCQLNSRKLQQCNRCHRQTSIPIHRRNHLRLHQAAPHGVVSGHLPHDPGQERGLGDEAAPPSGYLLQRRVAQKDTKMMAGDDVSATVRAYPLSGSNLGPMMPYRASEAAASAVVAREPARRPLSPMSRGDQGKHPLRMKLTVVEGFRLTEIAAWAQLHLVQYRHSVGVVKRRPMGMASAAAGCVHQFPVVVGSGRAAVDIHQAPRVSMGEYSRQHQETPCAASYHPIDSSPSMLSDISRSSSIVSIVASTSRCLTSSRDLSTWRSGHRRCRNGCSSYA